MIVTKYIYMLWFPVRDIERGRRGLETVCAHPVHSCLYYGRAGTYRVLCSVHVHVNGQSIARSADAGE